jgi:ankyrin repeat protein
MSKRLEVNVIAALGATLLLSAATPPEAPVADAAMRGDIDRVRVLLHEGADVNAAHGDGMTALHWAADRGDPSLAEVLLAAGANVASLTRLGDYTPLHLAGRAGHADVVSTLL